MSQRVPTLTYSIDEAAKLLGVGTKGCRDAAKRGELPAIRIGKRLMIVKPKLDAMLSNAAPASLA